MLYESGRPVEQYRPCLEGEERLNAFTALMPYLLS
jgi:hypothetical protein